MVKRHTIAILATDKAVPLKLTARQQALVDAVANRVPPAEHAPYRQSTKRARKPAGRAEDADSGGQNAR
jgi:hypothetical protein